MKPLHLRWQLTLTIFRTEKDGDWNIYPYFLTHKNPNNAHKNAKRSSKNFKLSIHNVASTGKNFCKKELFICLLAVLGFQSIMVKCTAAGGLGPSRFHQIQHRHLQ